MGTPKRGVRGSLDSALLPKQIDKISANLEKIFIAYQRYMIFS